jgi:hypothetical protein
MLKIPTNNVNKAQLYRPATELLRFCHAQQGKFERGQLNRAAEHDWQAYQERKADGERFCAEQVAAGQTAAAHCLWLMERAEQGRRIEPEPEVEIEQSAAPNAFGRFTCVQAPGAKHEERNYRRGPVRTWRKRHPQVEQLDSADRARAHAVASTRASAAKYVRQTTTMMRANSSLAF